MNKCISHHHQQQVNCTHSHYSGSSVIHQKDFENIVAVKGSNPTIVSFASHDLHVDVQNGNQQERISRSEPYKVDPSVWCEEEQVGGMHPTLVLRAVPWILVGYPEL